MPMKTMHDIEIQTPEEALQQTEGEIQKQLEKIWRMIADRESAERVNNEGIALRGLLNRWNMQMNRWKLEGKSEKEYFARKEARDALA